MFCPLLVAARSTWWSEGPARLNVDLLDVLAAGQGLVGGDRYEMQDMYGTSVDVRKKASSPSQVSECRGQGQDRPEGCRAESRGCGCILLQVGTLIVVAAIGSVLGGLPKVMSCSCLDEPRHY